MKTFCLLMGVDLKRLWKLGGLMWRGWRRTRGTANFYIGGINPMVHTRNGASHCRLYCIEPQITVGVLTVVTYR